MKRIYFILLLIIFGAIFTFTSCAKRGTITGGAKDTLAPKIINSFPENYKTNFNGKEIKITFNELIKVKDINKQLIISPPMKRKPIIVPQGSASKFISIKILDTLQDNTTYSFNFGQSIIDNNESNPYSQFKYVFSTGTYIDSLTLMGKIKDAYDQKVENFVSIQLYDAKTFNDSTVYNETPLYVSNTLDSLKVFALENLKAGNYKIVALKDKNSNYKFDPKSDKIAFLKETLSIPNDTLFQLELFKEVLPFKATKVTQESTNKFLLATEGNNQNIKVTALNGSENIPIIITKYPQKNTDSIQLFIPNIKMDSLQFKVEKGAFSKTFKVKVRELKTTDSLKIEISQTSILPFREKLALISKTPIVKIDNSKITLLNKDSVAVIFTTAYNEFKQKIEFDFKKEEEQKYNLEILPGAFVDFYSTSNDTLNYKLNTKSYSEYGNLKVNLKNAKRYPLILEILNVKSEVIASAVSNGEGFLRFDLIEPNVYSLRVIYDDNKNGIWDTGNYLEKRQAEEVKYYSKSVDVRANWDVDQDFILD
ncbi:Ig-like domain-containing protein [Flavobacterium sp.]|jgi:hypothetical protein|uniref:Ig-like domain-containing protein n=1 Tax=Flavobacterium sp. TaxID=239 RepID=UPI002A800CE0|nr:Ig-like domain-containing protein [Flavobacterium sp.]